MARSKGVTISVKVPINWDVLTVRKRQRLKQIVGRDTRVIRAFLGVIEQHEDTLLTGRNRNRIDESKLNELTLTAIKVKTGTGQRLTVPHDFKTRFPRISVNEITECRQTAVSLYESYLALKKKKRRKTSRPCEVNSFRRIPRWTFSTRFKLVENNTNISNWWLDIRDSFDSVKEGRMIHDRLLVPLKISPFHHNQINSGEIKAAQIFNDRNAKWWVTFAIRVSTPDIPSKILPLGVLGIDLGVKKAACTALVTPEKVLETRYFRQKEKFDILKDLDKRFAKLQKEMDIRKNNHESYDKIALELRRLRDKRERVSKGYDRFLVSQLREYVLELSKKYDIYVAIGRLTNIRQRARKGNGRGRTFRTMIHRWSFSRITESFKHQLSQLGWDVISKNTRFRVVPENWTSIMCWKCGRKGIRPRQNLFVCPTCGNKCNADMNGAINIAGRLITLTDSLHSVGGLGKWASAIARSTRPKARGKIRSSRGKSLLSKRSIVLDSGESAAIHQAQTSLFDFGDKIEMGDNDPTVESTVEKLSVVGTNTPTTKQKKEAKTMGGIQSR